MYVPFRTYHMFPFLDVSSGFGNPISKHVTLIPLLDKYIKIVLIHVVQVGHVKK